MLIMKNIAFSCLLGAAAAVTALLVTPSANADEGAWPSRPIKIIVPTGAGAGTDLVTRAFAKELSPLLGQPVVVENRPGAGGVIGTGAAKSAPADGYTLLVGNGGTHNINQYLFTKLPYDPISDFAPISLFGVVSNVLLVPKESPANTVQQLVAVASRRPGTLDYGVGQTGSSGHMAAELFLDKANLKMVRISYRGANEAYLDLLAGRVQMLFAPPIGVLADIKLGRVKVLAQTGSHRLSILPDVPTVAESGFPGFEASGWFGLFAPAHAPKAVVDKLATAVQKAAATLQKRKTFADLGMSIVSDTPAEFANYMQADRMKWAPIARAAGLRPE
jgi:tripartite-type tricarboxylate transporter receptor subunit TctC